MGKDFERSFGVEIECIGPVNKTREYLAVAINRDAGVPCISIPRETRFVHNAWAIKTDGSLHSTTGWEIVSPPLVGGSSFDKIERVCATLQREGCHISDRCGLHVHVDAVHPISMNIDALKRLALLYIEHETILDGLMPLSRRGKLGGDGFCRGFESVSITRVKNSQNVPDLITALRPDAVGVRVGRPSTSFREHRYVKLNFVSILRFGTVEFRHHSGTLEPMKIINWICACQRMVEYALIANEAEITTEARQVIKAVRRGSKRAIIVDMLLRPEGCSREEVLAATGWEQVSIAGVGHCYGLRIQKQRGARGRREMRYYGFINSREPDNAGRLTQHLGRATNVSELCKRLHMDEDEIGFWTARSSFFARPSMALVNG